MKKINWCFKIKNGLKFVEPSEIISKSYLEQSEKTLSKIKELIEEEDFVWASARIYYSAYYLILSFLYRVGVKSENHDCSIKLVEFLLNKKLDLKLFKENRVDSQYYFKFKERKDLLDLYSKIKLFYLEFKKIILSLNEKEIEDCIKKIKGAIK